MWKGREIPKRHGRGRDDADERRQGQIDRELHEAPLDGCKSELPSGLGKQTDEEANQEREKAEVLLNSTAALKITNQESLDTALEQIKVIKGSWKALDTERKKATKPLDDAKKVIMDWFRPVLDALKARETEMKAASVKYLETRKTDVKMEGAALVDRWRAVIIDKSIMPIEWLEPKIAELNKLATATKGASPIPGVEFVKETGMSSGSK